MWEYRARLIEVLDGDTIRILVDTGFYGRHEVDLRLKDVDAPELDVSGGPETTATVEAWMNQVNRTLSWPLLVITMVTKLVEPKERTSFRRYIGDVYRIDTGAQLNAWVRKYVAEHPEWTDAVPQDP